MSPIDSLDSDSEKTQPPVDTLRHDTPLGLYATIPQIGDLTQQRPRDGENPLAFLARLRASTTPEEAVTFTAFAALPRMAIWWGYECLRTMPDTLSADDRHLMELVAAWTADPTADNRHRTMREALWARTRSPATFLGLAVGWSGGSIAPNDPAPVPVYRAPRAINSSVLSCLARADLSRRSIHLARFIDMAETLFRVH